MKFRCIEDQVVISILLEWQNFVLKRLLDIGHAFKNFGKAMGTTMKVAFTDESNSNGEGKKTKTGEAWTEVGHGFRDLGKQIGKTAKELVDSVDEKENKKDINKEEAIDVEFEEKK